ncbi:hypothetical protein [Chryseobacterium sp. T1]
MIVIRFLLNEKGRVNPDSIRYMRQAHLLPIIDNTTAPLGYPFSIKILTYIGLDEFWSSKLIGILAFTIMLIFSYRKRFYFKEVVATSALFSFVSIFSYTMSEALTLPFVFFLIYLSKEIIDGKLSSTKAIIGLSILLIILYNIRYSALFIMAAMGWFGLLNIKKYYGKYFIISAIVGIAFIIFFKFFYIDYFNKNYVDSFLNIGLKPTSQLLIECFQGLTTSFNPFIHIADPNGGKINFFIYGIGLANIIVLSILIIKNKLTDIQNLMIWISIIGITCSYFVQFFYSVNAIDYRLLSPFILPIWLVYFQLLFKNLGSLTYCIPLLSLITGFAFTWLSKGNYLENRKEIQQFLHNENLEKEPMKFYLKAESDMANIRSVEIISTVNPDIRITFDPKDTLRPKVLTPYKVDQKLNLQRNNFQKFNRK